jgi:hypothetical protein
MAVLCLFFAEMVEYDRSVTRRPEVLKGMFANTAEFYVKDLTQDFQAVAGDFLREVHNRARCDLDRLSVKELKEAREAFPGMEMMARMHSELKIVTLLAYARRFPGCALLFEYLKPL